MNRKGKKTPQDSRRCEEKAAAPAADAHQVRNEARGSGSGEVAAAASSLGPKDWLLAAALVVAVFLVYQPAWQGGYLWDDNLHLLENPVLQPGGLAKVWVPGGYKGYWPLTYTAYWLQSKLWGLNPIGFHFVNIAVHALSALLLWRILVQLRLPGAMFAAAIFALHPVNVESVAWIAQLKGLLSLMLALVSVLLFLAHERQGGWWRSALAIGAFGLSALAKGIAITLPLVLLACAWWQRGRIARRDLLGVVPYLLMGAIMAGMNIWTQHLEGSEGAVVRTDGFLSRSAIAGCAVWFYFGKLIWPVDLCFVYPRWQIDERAVLSYLPDVFLAILLGLAWWRRGTWGRPIVMLIVCYVGLLLPVLGFVNILFMCYSLVADHWQYAAMIVPCAVLAGGAATLCRRRKASEVGWAELASPTKRPLVGLATMLRTVPSADPTATHAPKSPRIVQGCLGLALLAVLGVLTWRQSRMYADRETLYRTTIERNPDCWMAHNNLGAALADRGQVEEAIAHYHKALEIHPDNAEAHYNLGKVLAGRGEVAEAIAHYRKALELRPDLAATHNNLGVALAGRGEVAEAIAHYRKALEIKPDYAEAHSNLGLALAGRGEVDEAIAHYRKALESKPDDVQAHCNLGKALAGRGGIEEAVAHYRQALEIKPDFELAHNCLGLALAGRGEVDEAIAHFRKALDIKPDYAEAHVNLGVALARRGRVDEAIAHFRKALEIKPGFAEAHYSLGLALAGHGRVDEAITHFRKALEIKPDFAEAHINLGDALAGRGRLDEAVAHYQKALSLASARNDSALVNVIRARIRLHPLAAHAP